jgi:diguanylate cyclase (GGDEF)-like protein
VEGLEVALQARGDDSRWHALLFIDLDQFKVLNDTKGHHIGDQLLCGMARRLKNIVGPADLVARLGGDEFVILLHAVGLTPGAAESHVAGIAERVQAAIAAPFALEGFPVPDFREHRRGPLPRR